MISATYLKFMSRDLAKSGMWDMKAGRVGRSLTGIDKSCGSGNADTPYEKNQMSNIKAVQKKILSI